MCIGLLIYDKNKPKERKIQNNQNILINLKLTSLIQRQYYPLEYTVYNIKLLTLSVWNIAKWQQTAHPNMLRFLTYSFEYVNRIDKCGCIVEDCEKLP